MKKSLSIIGIFFCLFTLVIITTNEIQKLSKNLFSNISYAELSKVIEKDVYIYFYKTDCPACSIMKGTLNQYLESNPSLHIFALNVNENNETSIEIRDNFDIKYTPTIIHFSGGNEINRIVGSVGYMEFKQFIDDS